MRAMIIMMMMVTTTTTTTMEVVMVAGMAEEMDVALLRALTGKENGTKY